jgi:hypothetical protein
MAATDAAGKMSVLERVRQVETGIVRGGMSHPFVVLVDVGRLGVSGLISEITLWATTLFLSAARLRLSTALFMLRGTGRVPLRAMGGNMALGSTTASAAVLIALRV